MKLKEKWAGAKFAVPVYFFLAFALFYPLYRVLSQGLGRGLLEVFSNPYYIKKLFWSLEYGLGSAALCSVLSLVLAYFFRFRFWGREFWLALSAVPFVLPTIVVGMGFLGLVGSSGALRLNLVGTPWILFWAATFYNLGLVLRPLVAQIAQVEQLMDASRVLGSSRVSAFLKVGVPALLPMVLSGASLVFLYCFSSFGIPLLLGGQRFSTLEVETYYALSNRLAFTEATGLVVLQLLLSVPAVLIYLRVRAVSSNQFSVEPTLIPKGGSKFWLPLGVGAFFVLLYSPLFSLFAEALLHPAAWTSVWSSERFTPAGIAIENTTTFALLAMVPVLVVGALYALAVWKGSKLLDFIGLFPLMVSPIAIGLGALMAYPSLAGSRIILVSAYALLSYPLLARTLIPALRMLPNNVIEAGRTLGANGLRRWVRLEWPLIRPMFLAGIGLSLSAVVGEFGATLVLQRPEWTTLSLAIYERLGRPGQQGLEEAKVLAGLLGAGFLLVSLLLIKLQRNSES